ncbi:MAG: hypothetical protein EBU90_04670 [Proteobacteria bacterium]|nr:hypothetical protein [Pseudomonadota bacterium]NBP13734.1 hypothetical protein [bacterium]
MKQLNVIPIENFLHKARIALKSSQKNLVLTMEEVTELSNSLSVVMTRLAGDLDQIKESSNQPIQIKVDGGRF